MTKSENQSTCTYTCLPGSAPPVDGGNVKVLVIVEGTNDIEFLRRISRILHAHDSAVPDLADMELRGQLIFLPTGGVISLWARRLEPLGLPEFHLLDHEVPPETELRRAAADMINARHDGEVASWLALIGQLAAGIV